MKTFLVGAAAALVAALVVALPAAADGGRGWDWNRVCRGFAAKGEVGALGERAFSLSVAAARPSSLEGETVELRTGSRTRVDGSLAVGATVKAHGTVCQLDSADAPVFYTWRVQVKKPRAEKPRGSFKLAGEVVTVGGDGFEVAVSESNIDSFVGKTLRVRLDDRTEVAGDLVAGARAIVAGKAKIVGGEAVLLASFVLATGGDVGDGGGGPPDAGE
jgi:hypothetical protein